MGENNSPQVRAAGGTPWVGRWFAGLGLGLALLGAALVLLPGPGYRGQLLELGPAFTLLRWGALVGLVGGFVSLLALPLLFIGRVRWALWAGFALIGLLVGAASFGLPWALLQQARSVPSIHDITTDTAQPPVFHALLHVRQKAPNSAVYGGPSVARAQQQAYPDIQPLHLPVSPKQAFAAALDVAKGMGWGIAAAAPQAGRIEATATTFWFGFKDDVVIRVRAAGPGVRVDIRSVSRVGVNDLGKNAERIRQFRDRLTRALIDEPSAPAAS
ncbi:DUF1499 domain-containing protein [Nitrococcus mobilis]|uniref:DUF1499 domain-containing protein n=1 Tax=Nitrococcus mobilis Nb-231 TaxID=314278 RepID=A4BV81_9GAMM|nr:DUF1499 domain-containing protein [Nitrococcus mobilis]EAR20348.1 hypothetical protein NB231_06735 [Nitrococcus mobilis Nb-231]